MQQIITAKLKLNTTPEQRQLLRQTQLAYWDALNHVSRYAFEHGKLSNHDRLQKGTYNDIRFLYKLPSQMACNVPRQVASAYKGLWTKLRKNLEHRKADYTKKRYRGLDKAPKYLSPTVTYNYGYDYTFKPGQQVSVLTLQGRIIVSYQGYEPHVALIHHGATIGAAKLWYDKEHKQFYLLVSLELKVPDPTIALSGRERRLKLQVDHTITKSIIQTHPHTLIGLEELTGIRERTRRRKRRRKKQGKGTQPVSQKARRANLHASRWAFAELHSMLTYKAAVAGSFAIKVDADYTSQTCPYCGYADKRNRPGKGLLFVCQHEHCPYQLWTERPYTLHADLVGARNIALRTLLARQDWVRTGVLSVRPDVSDDETKAARLKRYAELRWSSDTSSSLEG